jgi:uncharacterized protein (DUF2062 family)
METVDRFPDQGQARRLVISLAIFWALWGLAAGSIEGGGPVAIEPPSVVGGILAGLVFYITLFEVWRAETGLSPLRMMFFPSRGGSGAFIRIIRRTLRRKWIWHTLRATGWPPVLLASGLGILLAGDLVLFGLLFTHPPRG